ncbi:MAG: zinc-ribbon domain-containing protein [Sediminicola sp.]
MILFFGTKSGKIRTTALLGIDCPFCGQADVLMGTSVPIYFHLFWIPLFKVSTNRWAQCSHCKKMYDQTEFTEDIKHKIG